MGIRLNNASRNKGISFESPTKASNIIVKRLFPLAYWQKKYRYSVRNVAMALVAAVTLSSATFAWYVSNTSVKVSSSTISAQANGMTLQIVEGTVPDHGKDSATIALGSTEGHEISPSSTDDIRTWCIPGAWSTGAMVSGYSEILFSDVETGEYKDDVESYYAYNVSTYTVYTIRQTGIADLYLDGSAVDGAITVTSNGEPLIDKIAKSLRIGIATVDNNQVETLKVVYAPAEPSGYGNDVYSKDNNITGWITVSDTTRTKMQHTATYMEIIMWIRIPVTGQPLKKEIRIKNLQGMQKRLQRMSIITE